MILLASLLVIALAPFHAAPTPVRARPYKARRARASDTVRIDGDRYGPRRRFKGISTGSFEFSGFGGCWFTASAEYAAQFEQLGIPKPPPRQEIVHYELEFIGRQTVEKRGAKPGLMGGYGHLGMSSCQIRAETLISARLLPPDEPPPG